MGTHVIHIQYISIKHMLTYWKLRKHQTQFKIYMKTKPKKKKKKKTKQTNKQKKTTKKNP